MKYTSVIVSRTSTEVLPLDDAKRDLDITFDDDNALVQQNIDTAVNWVEAHLNQFLQPVVIDLYADCLPTPLRLPYGPVTAVTSVTVDGVAVDGIRPIGGSPYAVLPAAGALWPFTATGLGGIVIRYSAGYAEGQVPKGIISAIRAIIAIYYDKPTGSELGSQWDAVERMLRPYRQLSI